MLIKKHSARFCKATKSNQVSAFSNQIVFAKLLAQIVSLFTVSATWYPSLSDHQNLPAVWLLSIIVIRIQTMIQMSVLEKMVNSQQTFWFILVYLLANQTNNLGNLVAFGCFMN